ncbi:MAG: hypothetical protein WKG32_06355 [Gemmatimonadaceae bacterium]
MPSRIARPTRRLLLLPAAALYAACVTVRGARETAPADYSRDVGVATALDIAEGAARLLDDGQYEVVRRDGPPEIYFETLWRSRGPFADEVDRGATAAQSRVLLRGRRRPRIGTARDLFAVRVTVENRVLLAASDGWQRVPATPMFVEHAAGIARQLELRLRSGVRRYD